METLLNFRALAEREGRCVPDPLPQDWPLEKWFAAICDLPIAEFTVFDLARSCRQNMYVDIVMPYCIRALQVNPLAGELYDGELLTAVIRLSFDYWLAHAPQHDAVVTICQSILHNSDDEDLNAQIEMWLKFTATRNDKQSMGDDAPEA